MIKRSKLFQTKIDDEVTILNTKTGYYYGLDNIGSVIWEYLGENGQTFENLCQYLMELYEVDINTCTKDTKEFIHQMKKEGLIEIQENA